MSLRTRLLLGLVVLVSVGLAATDLLTYRALEAFLLKRVDEQVLGAVDPVASRLLSSDRRAAPSTRAVPGGSYGALLDTDGHVVARAWFGYEGDVDKLPEPVLDGDDLDHRDPFTAHGTGAESGAGFRVLVTALSSGAGNLVVAVPLRDVVQTLHRLIAIELVASGAVLVGVGALALVVVRAGLRPLEDIEETAGAIAAGDLSQRVERAEPRTEVGRLGLSLNAMLAQIQTAFEARAASENKLRRFVADASHELRTPLTSIRGYAEMFRRGASERPEDLATAMRRIEEESKRMGVLVDDMLLLARLDQGRPLERERVDLARVAADAVQDARAVEPGRPITLECADGAIVLGDELRLRQVAANLLGNARQHTPPTAPVHVGIRRENGSAVLEVADEGPGLFPEEAEKVFERFYRADPSRNRNKGGTGLGLSIVAAVAEAHGGQARVESRPGHGARFWVELPLAPASEPESEN